MSNISDLDRAVHLALTRVHATREALALRHGEAEARLHLYEAELAGRDPMWQGSDDARRIRGGGLSALG